MTLNEAREKILNELKDIYEQSEAMNIADLVLEKVSGKEKTDRLLHHEIFLSPEQIEELKKILARLKQNEPVQYALEEAWFAGIKFKVNSNVLIPRPETEELVDWIIKESETSKVKSQKILDIGTGSGCIPVALKKKMPNVSVSAIDVCSEAIFIAAGNAADHNTDIDFTLMDFLDEGKWEELDQFDVIVSNPPYIRQSEAQTIHERVKDFEPRLALFVPDNDALLFFRKLGDFAKTHLNPGGSLFVEINESLGNDVAALFESKGFKSVQLRKDMQGKDRMIKAAI